MAGYLTNDPSAAALEFVVTSVTIPTVTWVGAPTNTWDLTGALVWKVGSNSAATHYQEGDIVRFDDSAANFGVNLAATVAPNGVVVSNSLHNYNFTGKGGLTGYTSLVKQGGAALTLGTSNSYSGATVISAGTLALGGNHVIPGGIEVNGQLDLAGFDAFVTDLSGMGVVVPL